MSSAYLLVSHGSRDRRPEIAMQQLARLVCHKLPKNHNALNSEHLVGIAALEMNPQPLHEQIIEFAKSAFGDCKLSQNENRLKIVPLFLLPGVHVMTDIPAEVALAQQAIRHLRKLMHDPSPNLSPKRREALIPPSLEGKGGRGVRSAREFKVSKSFSEMSIGQDIMIELQPYLGSHPNLEKLLAKQIAAIKTETWILLAHGSRRPGSKETVEAMAASLSAVAAYWTVPGSLESRVKELVAAGYKEIAILPYFLFAGGITDAIAASIEELKLQFSAVNFQLAEPLGASAELAELIWDLTDR